jgi:signal transduction histidine kinase
MNILRNKLIFSYSIISLLIVIILNILFNFSVNHIFEQFAIDQRKQQIEKVIDQVNDQYYEDTNLYNTEGLEVIGNAALQNGIMIHIQTLSNEIDWDIRQHKVTECQMILQHAENNMHSKFPNFKGGYVEEKYDLKNKEKTVGYLTVGFYGPYSFDDNELLLIKALNKSFLLIGMLFLIISCILGSIIAKKVTDPVLGVINVTRKITDKEYGVQTQEISRTKEMANLIAAINQMSLALEQGEKQKKQITADVAHELRTPLCNLQSHMEAMIDGIWEPTSARLVSCHAEILRLNKIIDQLQELYLLENMKNIIVTEKFDFQELCKDLIAEFELMAQSKEVQLIMQVPSNAPVYADYNRIKQCMINLISNAITYIPVDGNVILGYKQKNNHTILSIIDNGPGIPEEDLPFIFERFYRVDKSRNQKTGGMGIGLSISKAIINAHGGELLVESQLGVGSTFKIIIPLSNDI